MTNPTTCDITLVPLGRTLTVPRGSNLGDAIHFLGLEFPCGGKGTCGNCKVRLLAGHIALSPAHRAVLERKKLGNEWRLACLSTVEEDITIEVAQFENIVLADDTPFRFTPRARCGIAVDLGSTTLVSQLLDMESGQVLAVQTALNPQAVHGADIMSRIGYAMQSPENAARLTSLIRGAVGSQVEALAAQATRPLQRVRIVGNSVMHHLFCGLDVTPLSAYPFESPCNGMMHFTPAELGWAVDPALDITFLPNIGSFVGSDILAGIYAAGMFSSAAPRVLVDLGTNGEIAVGNRDGIACASTAAGPAFEGSNISCGMRASTGAISSITAENGHKEIHVIGGTAAKGICGSGLIDAIYLGVTGGEINEQGVIQHEPKVLPLTDGVSLEQRDIREFQLAKAAVATGVELLLRDAGLTHEGIDKMFIAGGFGNYIDLAHATSLGLLEFAPSQIVKLSNSALIGAKMFLFQEDGFIDSLLPLTRHISLESDPGFLDTFCEKILFTAR